MFIFFFGGSALEGHVWWESALYCLEVGKDTEWFHFHFWYLKRGGTHLEFRRTFKKLEHDSQWLYHDGRPWGFPGCHFPAPTWYHNCLGGFRAHHVVQAGRVSLNDFAVSHWFSTPNMREGFVVFKIGNFVQTSSMFGALLFAWKRFHSPFLRSDDFSNPKKPQT